MNRLKIKNEVINKIKKVRDNESQSLINLKKLISINWAKDVRAISLDKYKIKPCKDVIAYLSQNPYFNIAIVGYMVNDKTGVKTPLYATELTFLSRCDK